VVCANPGLVKVRLKRTVTAYKKIKRFKGVRFIQMSSIKPWLDVALVADETARDRAFPLAGVHTNPLSLLGEIVTHETGFDLYGSWFPGWLGWAMLSLLNRSLPYKS
jgi:hypothetical protein